MITRSSKSMKYNTADDIIIKTLSSKYSKIIHKDDLPSRLQFSKNGTGDRWCKKKYRYTVVYVNGNIKSYHTLEYDIVKDIKIKIFLLENINRNQAFKGHKIVGVFVHGENNVKNGHPIKSSIIKEITKRKCIVCGNKRNIECDHKNDFYNDKRVLSIHTQIIDDFQPLCRQCNLRKRGICQIEHKEKKLFSAKELPEFDEYDFEFTWEKKSYDINDKNCKKDTFWYDPKEFRRKVRVSYLERVQVLTHSCMTV